MFDFEVPMRIVLDAASEVKGDVPVAAAVLNAKGAMISLSVNNTYAGSNPIGHAEILAIQEAGRNLGTSRLDGYSLVTNLEPCPMCAGAIRASRLSRLIFGTNNDKNGACGSAMDLLRGPPNQVEVISGVLAYESSLIMSTYFRLRR